MPPEICKMPISKGYSILWCQTQEPDPEACHDLNAMPETSWRLVRYFPVAVGGRTGLATLHVPPNPEGASLLPHNHRLVERFGHSQLHGPGKEIEVEVVTLDDASQRFDLPPVDYLKLDVEGSELAVLQSGNDVIANCLAIKVECSFLEQRIGQPLIWDVVSYLRQRGFEVVDICDVHKWRRRPLPVHPYVARHAMPYSKGICAQCDVIFLRDPVCLSDKRLLSRLAFVAAVLGFFDEAFAVVKGYKELSYEMDEWADFQSTLMDASRVMGRRESSRFLLSQLRGLIPGLRSLFGGIRVGYRGEY